MIPATLLKDLRVLDLSRLLPGPFCSMVLSDHGARVLKLEAPGEGDYIRSWEPRIDNYSALFLAVNRNKKSLTLDLKTELGQEIFFRLVREYDVVLESFRPGVVSRLGIDYHRAKEVNEKIIYCSITGYGQFGPEAQKAGHDLNYLAESVVLHTSGCPDGQPVVSFGEVAANEHFRAREMFYNLDLPEGGSIRQLNSAIMVDGKKRMDHQFPPGLGEHTEEILLSLGYLADEIELFRQQGIV
jgi:crotonobetainyl-CoA:carnitine CoA-transferase CaiB-like acyl-CoA transferase